MLEVSGHEATVVVTQVTEMRIGHRGLVEGPALETLIRIYWLTEHVQYVRHEESRVMEARSLAWVPVWGWCFLWQGYHLLQGCCGPLSWERPSCSREPLTLMACLMKLSLAGFLGAAVSSLTHGPHVCWACTPG